MPTCIYCRRTDPPGGFTTEHVLLAAFGGFGDAPTLIDAVCGECNQYFGDHLDRLFARDSAEALLRLYYGLKEPSAVAKMLKDRVSACLTMGAAGAACYSDSPRRPRPDRAGGGGPRGAAAGV